MKLLSTLLILLFSLCHCYALTSDTIHVKRYSINVDTVNYSTQTIRGHTTITVESKLNGVNNITLSLLRYTIDSITSGNQALTYTYNDTLIRITPPATLNQNDTIIFTIGYHGHPQQDPQFGGFYFSGNYAFSVGVGFLANPHPYGRTWFPCNDEFVDKALFDFHVMTDSGYKAFCNGALDSTENNSNGTITWNWSIDKPIPSYLASVAVAPFYTIYRTYQGIPVEIACTAYDSAATLATFQHLDSCLGYFINFYGPYPWNKVGYILVPTFEGGMEHATSIHIFNAIFDGTLNYETVWAHELSHQWWGDKVTTSSEQDMWLNEGFAVSNEHLFTEMFYGEHAYDTIVRHNHRLALQFAHVVDSGYYALNAIPHEFTYGNTVYKKGPDIVHTLRKYLGDSAYFFGCREYLDSLAYGNTSSDSLRNILSGATGTDLTAFFNDWVFTPGSPHFSVDSFNVVPDGGNYDVTVYTRQKQKGNTHIYTEPVECTFSDGVNDTTVTMFINATTNLFNFTFTFSPVRETIDKAANTATAIVADEQTLSAAGSYTFQETNATVVVKNVGAGSSDVRIEHNYVAPDNFKVNPGIRVSDYHYYRVDGIFQNGFVAAATFIYNGSTNVNSGFLDNTLITGLEDSLVLLYRTGAGDDWHVVTDYTQSFGSSHTDKEGSLTVDTLLIGEYCFGYRDYLVTGLSPLPHAETVNFTVSPNPVSNTCTLGFRLPYGGNGLIEIFDATGKLVFSTQIFSHQQFVNWDTFYCKSGLYSASVFIGDRKVESANIMVVH